MRDRTASSSEGGRWSAQCATDPFRNAPSSEGGPMERTMRNRPLPQRTLVLMERRMRAPRPFHNAPSSGGDRGSTECATQTRAHRIFIRGPKDRRTRDRDPSATHPRTDGAQDPSPETLPQRTLVLMERRMRAPRPFHNAPSSGGDRGSTECATQTRAHRIFIRGPKDRRTRDRAPSATHPRTDGAQNASPETLPQRTLVRGDRGSTECATQTRAHRIFIRGPKDRRTRDRAPWAPPPRPGGPVFSRPSLPHEDRPHSASRFLRAGLP